MADTCNGWTNYETWVVNLWMDNEPGSQDFFMERAREILDDSTPTEYASREEVARSSFADWLAEFHDENVPQLSGVYADLMRGALDAVNWMEIARYYIDAAK